MRIRLYSPYDRPLAITEEKLAQICDVYDRHARGEKLDIEGMQAAVNQVSGNQTGGSGYTIQDGVALIDVEGVIGKRMNFFMYFSGGTSTELLQKDVTAAAADDSVHSIVLMIDSPGGEVDGTQLAADAIKAAAAKKPVVAWVTGLGASAAYWLASSADKIVLADDTTAVGSIGVVAVHVDRSKQDATRGVQRTEVTAGKYKRIASDTAPLTQEGRANIQAQVDHIYSVFVDAVAAGRDMSADDVVGTEAQILMGQKAIDAGLADGIATLDQVIAELNSPPQADVSQPDASASGIQQPGEKKMAEATQTFTEAQVNEAKTASFESGLQQGRTEGASAELARIKGIADLQMPGHGALVKTLMFDGKTSVGDAAVQINQASRKALVDAGIDLEKEASAAAPAAGIDPTKVEESAAGAKKPNATDDGVAYAKKIESYQAEQALKGRKLNVGEADAELAAAEKK